jgi:hypothetical protein
MLRMPGYKRNQVEEAIAKLLEPKSFKASGLRTQIKRLLNVDRKLGRTGRSTHPEKIQYAFFSSDPPGRGVEILFSEYEAFALATALLFMGQGWPQRLAVSILRRAREELETQHERILKQDRTQLFDPAAIMRGAKVGGIAFNNTDPVLLTVVSTPRQRSGSRKPNLQCSVQRGAENAFKWVRSVGQNNPHTMFDVVDLAHALKDQLAKIEPSRRGRGA